MPLPWPARIGVLIGLCAWTLPLAPLLVTAGGAATLWTHFVPAFGVALGLALGFLAVLQASTRLPPRARMQVIAGTLLWIVGLEMLLVVHHDLPLLMQSPDARRVLERTASVTDVPEWLPPLMLLAGLVLVLPCIRALLAPRTRPAPATGS